MTVDVGVVPGLLLLAAEFLALAAVGFVVARVALRQTDDRLALAQGLVIGLALWGLIVNFIQCIVLPGTGRRTGGLDCRIGPGCRPSLASAPGTSMFQPPRWRGLDWPGPQPSGSPS